MTPITLTARVESIFLMATVVFLVALFLWENLP